MSGWLVVIIVIAVVFELSHLAFSVFLFLAAGGLGKQHELQKQALHAVAQAVDNNFAQTNKNVHHIAQFLVQVFSLDKDELKVQDLSKKVTPPSGDLKN